MFRIDLFGFDSRTIEGRTIVATSGRRTSRYILPSGARMSKTTNTDTDRAVLEIGGYKTLTVTVIGTVGEIDTLFEFMS